MNKQPTLGFPWHIVFIYCLIGSVWILFSDLLVVALVPVEYHGVISIAKGWLFIVVTASILALLLRRYHLMRAGLERRLREIVDNLPSSLYAFDRDGRALFVNRAMLEMCGSSDVSPQGKDRLALGFSPEAAAEQRANDLRVFASGNPLITEESNVLADGLHIYLTVKFPLTATDGSIEAVCGVSTDITELKRAEEERERLQLQLNQSQKMEALGQLAGGVAHDFNNLLSVIIGYCHLLNIGCALGETQQEKLDHIIAAAEKASHLTNGLLTFSRKQVITPHTVDLNELMTALQKFLSRVIGEDIQLRTILSPGNLPVKVDRGLVEQALINLATNARDAMPLGGVLSIETGSQVIDTTFARLHGYGEGGHYAVITFSDSGCGMNEETRAKIFEPFFTTKEPGKGTGLGLSIVYGIVKQHGGFIDLYSEPERGSTFRIYLPLIDREPMADETVVTPPPPRGGGETILVVEDDPMVRVLVERMLSEYGYRVVMAGDGIEAVETYGARRGEIDLILMDMIMPGQSGCAAADEIWRLQPDMRILFTSGYTADFMVSRRVETKERELILKPYQPFELLRKIREMLDR
jgi:PAS domain S-box-containing protein